MIVDFRKYAEAQRSKDTDVVVALSSKIGEKRAVCLRRAGFDTLGDLSGAHVASVKIMYGFGDKTLRVIDDVLTDLGLPSLDYEKEDLTEEIYERMLEFMPEDEALRVAERIFSLEDSPSPT